MGVSPIGSLPFNTQIFSTEPWLWEEGYLELIGENLDKAEEAARLADAAWEAQIPARAKAEEA